MAKRAVPQLPEQIIAGYAHDRNVIEAVRNGVNVLIWFSIDLVHGAVQRGPRNLDSMRATVRALHREGYAELIHLICIGGWNEPHIDTAACSAEEYYRRWKAWNETVVADAEALPHGFHGFDWDLEGHDDPKSPRNVFSRECLDYMGEISRLAKADGLIVSMAPAQSYLDPEISTFSRRLDYTDPDWEQSIPGLNFAYHGRNCYAYLIAKYGSRLYEGYSRTLYRIRFDGKKGSEALLQLVESLVAPWSIKFSDDPECGLPDQAVRIPASKVVIGLANAWAGGGDGRFLLVQPDEVEKAYKACIATQVPVRGFAFWNIAEEGRDGLWLSKSLAEFMNTNQSQ
ncbi:hypothetical protein DFJ73DRAFT_860696 [Zopfochytrium polystomum]|nr:hypothetical protein DFJ73DRAFT_860696 [Zopfochytrium polystomum]